jgi:hypothetical protein
MRVKIFLGSLLLLILNTAVLYAQPGEPCGGTDPDAVCPLDTWIFVLAFIALTFAAIQLHRKQKSPLPMAKGTK